MESNKLSDQKFEVNFESHPPIEEDLEGMTTLLKQTFLHFADCNSLSRYLINLPDVTQVIAHELDEENESEEEPDNDIYGVISCITIQASYLNNELEVEARKQLTKFLKDKCDHIKRLLESKDKTKIALIINERYINLPPQLALPTLKDLTIHLNRWNYTHLIFLSKILLRSRDVDTKLPSKRIKLSGHSKDQDPEPIIYVNPEEEIIFEGSSNHTDFDVSAFCDENATWSSTSDIKYTPHRRLMIIEHKNWDNILKNLEKELNN